MMTNESHLQKVKHWASEMAKIMEKSAKGEAEAKINALLAEIGLK